MPQLTREQVDEFLATPVVARLATVKADGAPYVVPVWQHWDGEAMYVIPRGRSRFVEHLRAEPRVAVSCADDAGAGHRRVLIEGRAEIVEGPVPMAGRTLDIAREMAARYGGEAGLRYLDGTMDKPRYLLRIVPRHFDHLGGRLAPALRLAQPSATRNRDGNCSESRNACLPHLTPKATRSPRVAPLL